MATIPGWPMRRLYRFSSLFFLLSLAGSTPSIAESSVPPFTDTDMKAIEWCFSHFPFGRENPWAEENALPPDRPQLSPFETKGMLGPPGLITETEVAGELTSDISKYRGLWVWPTASMHPPLAIFVERLTPTEMTIAMVKRELYPKDKSPPIPDPLRHKLKWNGEAFLEEPEKPDGVGYHIRISEDGRAMFVVFVTRIEAMPGFCLISSKHY